VTTKDYLRTALQPYRSTKIVDIPMSNAPTSGAKIEGDQKFPSVKDFAEYILKYGELGLQTPTGNLWINGANLGGYEYYYYPNALTYTNPNVFAASNIYSSNDQNKCYFFVCRGNLTLNADMTTGITDSRGKKLTCVYVKGNILTNGPQRIINSYGSPSTDTVAEPITILPSPAGSYLYPRTSNTPYPNQAYAFLGVSSPFVIFNGVDGFPRDTNPDNDGLMYFGNGGSGATSSENNGQSRGGAGLRATPFGGGGGGGGSYNFESTYAYSNAITTTGSDADQFLNKSGYSDDVIGGAGTTPGANILVSGAVANTPNKYTGGSLSVFCTGTMTNISLVTAGASATSTNVNNGTVTGGGNSGGGPLFLMAKSWTNLSIATFAGQTFYGGGIGGAGSGIIFGGVSF